MPDTVLTPDQAQTAVDVVLRQGYRIVTEVAVHGLPRRAITIVLVNALGHGGRHGHGIWFAECLYNLGQDLHSDDWRPAPQVPLGMTFPPSQLDEWLRLDGTGVAVEYRGGRYTVTLLMDGHCPFYNRSWWQNSFTAETLDAAITAVTLPNAS